jgi:hypothetical protein
MRCGENRTTNGQPGTRPAASRLHSSKCGPISRNAYFTSQPRHMTILRSARGGLSLCIAPATRLPARRPWPVPTAALAAPLRARRDRTVGSSRSCRGLCGTIVRSERGARRSVVWGTRNRTCSMARARPRRAAATETSLLAPRPSLAEGAYRGPRVTSGCRMAPGTCSPGRLRASVCRLCWVAGRHPNRRSRRSMATRRLAPCCSAMWRPTPWAVYLLRRLRRFGGARFCFG